MERVTYDPGFYPDMPLEDYFADPAKGDHGSLNSSSIPTLRKKSPLHFATLSPVLCERYGLTPAEDAPNAAQCRGNVVHRLALGKGDEYEIGEFPDFRTNAAKEWREELQKLGKTPILRKEVADVQRQAGLLSTHLTELFMGEPWLPEVAVVWQEETPWGLVNCRALIDAWCPTLAVGADLKTTTDASRENATKQMERMGYDIQNRWYARGLGKALGLPPGTARFATLFGENKSPYASQSFELSEMWANSAWNECELALRTFAQCQKADKFPGYQRSSILVSPPGWLVTKRLDAELGIDDLNDAAGILDAVPEPAMED